MTDDKIILFCNSEKELFYYEFLYKKILDIPGNILELGVQWGSTMALLLNLKGIHEPFNPSRKIVGFDTFSDTENLIDLYINENTGELYFAWFDDPEFKQELYGFSEGEAVPNYGISLENSAITPLAIEMSRGDEINLGQLSGIKQFPSSHQYNKLNVNDINYRYQVFIL